jgi:hypothetical protein
VPYELHRGAARTNLSDREGPRPVYLDDAFSGGELRVGCRGLAHEVVAVLHPLPHRYTYVFAVLQGVGKGDARLGDEAVVVPDEWSEKAVVVSARKGRSKFCSPAHLRSPIAIVLFRPRSWRAE